VSAGEMQLTVAGYGQGIEMYTRALQIQKVVESRREILASISMDAGLNDCQVNALCSYRA
jgi:hypothetical protein